MQINEEWELELQNMLLGQGLDLINDEAAQQIHTEFKSFISDQIRKAKLEVLEEAQSIADQWKGDGLIGKRPDMFQEFVDKLKSKLNE